MAEENGYGHPWRAYAEEYACRFISRPEDLVKFHEVRAAFFEKMRLHAIGNPTNFDEEDNYDFQNAADYHISALSKQ